MGFKRIFYSWADSRFLKWGQRFGGWSVWCLGWSEHFKNLAIKFKR